VDFFRIRTGNYSPCCRQPKEVDWKSEFDMSRWVTKIEEDEEALISTSRNGVNNV